VGTTALKRNKLLNLHHGGGGGELKWVEVSHRLKGGIKGRGRLEVGRKFKTKRNYYKHLASHIKRKNAYRDDRRCRNKIDAIGDEQNQKSHNRKFIIQKGVEKTKNYRERRKSTYHLGRIRFGFQCIPSGIFRQYRGGFRGRHRRSRSWERVGERVTGTRNRFSREKENQRKFIL